MNITKNQIIKGAWVPVNQSGEPIEAIEPPDPELAIIKRNNMVIEEPDYTIAAFNSGYYFTLNLPTEVGDFVEIWQPIQVPNGVSPEGEMQQDYRRWTVLPPNLVTPVTANITQVLGLPIRPGEISLTVENTSPFDGELLKLIPGNDYNVIRGNAIRFAQPGWMNELPLVHSVLFSLVWHPKRSDRKVLINTIEGEKDADTGSVWFNLTRTMTSTLKPYLSCDPADCIFDVDFVYEESDNHPSGDYVTKVRGPAIILDPLT